LNKKNSSYNPCTPTPEKIEIHEIFALICWSERYLEFYFGIVWFRFDFFLKKKEKNKKICFLQRKSNSFTA